MPQRVSWGGFAGGEVVGLEGAPGFAAAAFLGEFEGEAEAAFDAAPSVDTFLDGDFVGGAFEDEAAGAGVEAFVVFADDDEVDVFGFLVFEGAEAFVVEFDGAEIDVLLQLEAEAEEDAFFEDAGFDFGVADGAQEDGGGICGVRPRRCRGGLPWCGGNGRRRDRNRCS